MPARLSASAARQLRLDGVTERAPVKRSTRREAAGPYRTRCAACAELFTSRAAEDRHVDATRHSRYELVLEESGEAGV